MSGAERIASALNRLTKDGLDFMGGAGADVEALNRLLDDYYVEPEEERPQFPGSKL